MNLGSRCRLWAIYDPYNLVGAYDTNCSDKACAIPVLFGIGMCDGGLNCCRGEPAPAPAPGTRHVSKIL